MLTSGISIGIYFDKKIKEPFLWEIQSIIALLD